MTDEDLAAHLAEEAGRLLVAQRDPETQEPAAGPPFGGCSKRRSPMSSSRTGRLTAIAITAGRKTQAYSLATAVSVLVVLLVARPVLSRFPTAALGGIVIFAALNLIDLEAFRRLLAFRRTELGIAVAACLGVLAFDILYGVLVAIALSVADLLVRVRALRGRQRREERHEVVTPGVGAER